ncbi:uncharacterized protein LOC125221826 isoform X1 [Salvia hispanica]|uniref:uncharacterized protein LOC125221826 isoform X1 n=1 Tax=Salvia hispanica TaxID=49212 RepID=UPI0020092207|nr:uncharacterized protein LOC125221826 isoform X1 [Salvia hispanica]
MQSRCTNHVSNMLYVLSRRLRRLCSTLRWFMWRPRPRPRVIIRRLGRRKKLAPTRSFDFYQNQNRGPRLIRLATFNAALFSLAPAVPAPERTAVPVPEDGDSLKSPKGILKQSSPLNSQNNSDDSKFAKLRPNKVSINLPENEISLAQDRSMEGSFRFNNTVAVAASAMRSPVWWDGAAALCGSRTIFDVLKEVDADILCLQDVKADEADDMRPLSDLASALGMSYVFAESWAPEFGNALLSRWPITKWRAERICDDKDFRNVIKATVEVPWMGEVNVYGTQLDHLDETWRMKQINAIMHSTTPHFLAGGLNSLDSSDYSSQRWNHIVKYYEELGKPTPKVEVTNLLKERGYTDSKHFAGECEPVVVIAKGQNVQGTCKYGTRVDYILGSEGLRYAFVPGSYSVVSSKGTSDHHIVKVDIVKVEDGGGKSMSWSKLRKRFVRMSSSSCSSKKWVESEMS